MRSGFIRPIMQRVLSLLVAYVFLQTQVWALSGGPVFAGAQQSLTGTYAGVIIPSLEGAESLDADVDPATLFGANSLGVFTIGVPNIGLAEGAVVLFFEGSFFTGGLIGVADPDKRKLFGVAQLIRIFAASSDGDGGLSVAFDARADGSFQADIKVENSQSFRLNGSGVFALQVFDFTVLDFVARGQIAVEIEGFRQSTQVVTPDAGTVADLLNT
jgi:hypothetical protein